MEQPTVGGWTPGRIQLSTFIRDFLAERPGGTWAFNIHQGYKEAVLAEPRHRGGKRRVISYHSFLNYMYILRKLGLIEYLRDEAGNISTEQAYTSVGEPAPQLNPRHFIRANMSRINDPAWQNPRKALYG